MDSPNIDDLMKFIDLEENKRRDIIQNVSNKTGLLPVSIEKDWWVVQVLKALFSLPYAEHLSFKGGTSLSKCWHLIERFSEDVDIAIDHEFLGFHEPLSKTQISDRLRRASCLFVRDTLQKDLREQMAMQGVGKEAYSVSVEVTPVSTTDPETITLSYRSLFDPKPYILNKVKIEVSGRSMSEPVRECKITSFIDKTFPDAVFSEGAIEVNAVMPERTFLEKVFLLQEEFAKPTNEIRVERMSRHMYDIVMMMNSDVATIAIKDKELYHKIIEHRRKYIGLKGFDYNLLEPMNINIMPPNNVVDLWRKDYEAMCQNMIFGKSPSFDQILESLYSLITSIREEKK